MSLLRIIVIFTISFLVLLPSGRAQVCTTLGQTPSTAFPVCGTTTFEQSIVPQCASNALFVPGCSNDGAAYENRNPFWYKFTCYQSGTLGFLITPNNLGDDYDWQLYDVTGLNPDDVYTNQNIVISGNWSGSSGLTGASSSGSPTISCASIPSQNIPTFTQMPDLVQGHDYILLISHFTETQSGYSLSFGGGTAVITDPTPPHLLSAVANCDGKKITIKLNKKMRCASLSADGSEFSIVPAVTTVVSATSITCTSGFDLNQVIITLAAPLPPNDYQLIINPGTDDNTLLDNCAFAIPAGEQVPFRYDLPQPTPADSVAQPGCAPIAVNLYFPKRIDCNSIAPDGSDFTVTGPSTVTVTAASGAACVGELSNMITVQFAAPIYTKGNYMLVIRNGSDGGTVTDECGQVTLPQSLPFSTLDTVSADFAISAQLGCQLDTLTFSHDGANEVNSWTWSVNMSPAGATPSIAHIFPATSVNTVGLAVSNGICTDSVVKVIELNNEVTAAFAIPDVICPEDPLIVTDSSRGQIDQWIWRFGSLGTNATQTPPPFQFPLTNRETVYTIQLTVANSIIGCTDTASRKLLVLSNCFIAVPTAFTPNGDGRNDYLHPNNAMKAVDLDFKVFNRWGQLVFSSRNWLEKWDGKIGGLPQPAGIYVWFLRYTNVSGQKVFQKGTTMLIR